MSNTIIAIDVGTSTIRVLIAKTTEENLFSQADEKKKNIAPFHIVGRGECPSVGLRNGVVTNIVGMSEAIKEALTKARAVAGSEVKDSVDGTDSINFNESYICVASVGGSNIYSINTDGETAVTGNIDEKQNKQKKITENKDNRREKEITEFDVRQAIQNAMAYPLLTEDKQILHTIPQNYIVNGDETNLIHSKPINVLGTKLKVNVHLFIVTKTLIRNIKEAVARANLELNSVVLKTYAAASVAMTDEEKEIGSILIDLGADTTDALVIDKDYTVCSCSIPLGQKSVTRDIALVQHMPEKEAEEIKIQSGCCWESFVDTPEDNLSVLIPGIGGKLPREISKLDLCKIIRPRIEEILFQVKNSLAEHMGKRHLGGNIVLVGGGANVLGITSLVSYVFNTDSVKIGNPPSSYISSDEKKDYYKPEYAVAAGLLKIAYDRIDRSKQILQQPVEKVHKTETSKNNVSILDKIKSVIDNLF